jgi:HEAT repeat protein
MSHRRPKLFYIVPIFIFALALVTWALASRASRPSKTTTALARAVYYSANPADREEALSTLRKMPQSHVPDLVRMLESRDSSFLITMWSWTRKIPKPLRKVSRMLPPLRGSQDRSAAARCLGLLGSQASSAVPALSKALQTDDRQTCFESARALGAIGEPAWTALLMECADRDPNIRFAVVSTIQLNSNVWPIAASALLNALGDENVDVRHAASGAWSSAGPSLLPFLATELADSDSRKRCLAATALTCFSPARAEITLPLLQLLQDQEVACRIQALRTFARFQFPNPQINEHLLMSLNDPAAEVRSEAARALSTSRRPAKGAVPALIKLLHDPDPGVRESTAFALGSIGPAASEARPALQASASDTNDSVRIACLDALAKTSR